MIIHPSVGKLSDSTIFALARFAQRVRPGHPRPHHHPSGTLTMTRTTDGRVILHRGPLSKDGFIAAKSITAPPKIEREGAKLWAELWGGADTPDERFALAYGALSKLPCGECRRHWQETLREFPPMTETDRAWKEWLWREHNKINARIGKPHFSYELAFPESRN